MNRSRPRDPFAMRAGAFTKAPRPCVEGGPQVIRAPHDRRACGGADRTGPGDHARMGIEIPVGTARETASDARWQMISAVVTGHPSRAWRRGR